MIIGSLTAIWKNSRPLRLVRAETGLSAVCPHPTRFKFGATWMARNYVCPFAFSSPVQCSAKQGREELLTVAIERGPSDSHYSPQEEWPRLPFTARIERAHSYRARSASKKGTWPLPLFPPSSLVLSSQGQS